MTKPRLRAIILEYIDSDEMFRQFIIGVEKTHDIIVFGGAVRDYVAGMAFEPRDIDLVLRPKGTNADIIEDLLHSICSGYEIIKNQFGGFKVRGKRVQADIWLLCDTWAFKQGLMDATPENLLNSVFLNIDAYAYHFTDMYFIEQCDEKELPDEIDYVIWENPKLELNIIRALCLSKKYGIELSTRLSSVVVQRYFENDNAKRDAIREQQRHYGEIPLDEKEITEIVATMKERIEHEKHML